MACGRAQEAVAMSRRMIAFSGVRTEASRGCQHFDIIAMITERWRGKLRCLMVVII